MKKLRYIAGAAAMAALTFCTTSCIDGNDWEVDSSYDRLFSVTADGISVSAKATTAEVKWDATPQTEYYIIEISTDSLYNEVAMGGTNAKVFGEDKSIVKSPYTLTGLTADTKYFLRIKSLSSVKTESKWSYCSDYSFTTATEQIFESVEGSDVTDNAVTLHWTAGEDVDRIEITDAAGTLVKSVEVTEEAKQAGEMTIDGLEQLTTYTATIYLGDVKRGVVTFTTNAKVPDADYTAYLADNDSLNNDLLNQLAEAGYQTVNIALTAGASYNNENTIIIPDGMSVTFFGLPGNTQAVISVKNFDVEGTHSFVRFENVELTGEYGDYLFNQSAAATVGSIEFSNCFIHSLKNTPFRLQGSNEKLINTLSFNNCIIYGAESRTYSLIHVDASSGKGKVENISFANSTIVYTGKSFVYCKNTDFTSLKVTDCTFSKAMGNGDYFLDCDKNGNGPQSIEITNCIFGSTAEAAKGIRANDVEPVVSNSYMTSDMNITGNKINGLISYEGGEADLFQDPANKDFTIIDNSFDGKRNCGDPRWYMK